jgi:hypothetical protein
MPQSEPGCFLGAIDIQETGAARMAKARIGRMVLRRMKVCHLGLLVYGCDFALNETYETSVNRALLVKLT